MAGVDLQDPALAGWRGVFKPDPREAGRAVVVLTSSDYDPAKRTGHLVTGRGDDADAALSDACALARRALLTTTPTTRKG